MIHHLTMDQKTALCGADISGDDHRLTHYLSAASCNACRETRDRQRAKPADVDALKPAAKICVPFNGRSRGGLLRMSLNQAVALAQSLVFDPQVRRAMLSVAEDDDERCSLIRRLQAAAILLEIS